MSLALPLLLSMGAQLLTSPSSSRQLFCLTPRIPVLHHHLCVHLVVRGVYGLEAVANTVGFRTAGNTALGG